MKSDRKANYERDGFISPVRIVDEATAREERRTLEWAESELGSMHYIDKVHTVLTSAMELATHHNALDVVEACIGPDILLYNTTYIIKEPGSAAHVAWHQDLTYWGLSDPHAQVSMWLALAPATKASGCMTMIPGSHLLGQLEHAPSGNDHNVLLLDQHIASLDTTGQVPCELHPGEASFHHGWTQHSSGPNVSDDRRIGLNVQYLAPHSRQANERGSAILVRGEDRFDHFGIDRAPETDLEPNAVAEWRALDDAMKQGFKHDPK